MTDFIDTSKISLHKEHDFCKSGAPKLTVVMVHGIASNAHTYDPLLEHLEQLDELRDVRFVSFDLLGAGHSVKADDVLNYGLEEQLLALENSIDTLKINTPLVLMGHSMGTIIVTRYADTHRKAVQELILVSPPIYRPEDFDNPLFSKAIDGFREVVGRTNHGLLEDKAFNNELKFIVQNPHNYQVLAGLDKPIHIIYGELDQIIASFNIPKLLKDNHSVDAVKTTGRHGVTHDKFGKISSALKSILEKGETGEAI